MSDDISLIPQERIEDLTETLGGVQPKLTSTNAGPGINITEEEGVVKISGVSSAPAWGQLTGTLSNQTDLQTALDGKISQLSSMPTSSASNNGLIVQYIGETTSTYTKGYFYKSGATGTQSSVTFTPASGTSTVISISADDFATFIKDTCAANPQWGSDGTNITRGDIGYYNNSLYSFSAFAGNDIVFAVSFSIADLESAGFTFTPYLEPQESVNYTCDIDAPLGYAWTRIDVQPGSDVSNKVDKTSAASKVYGTDSNGDQTTYDVSTFTSNDVFWAVYGTTTYAEITSAINAGKLVACRYYDTVYYLLIVGNTEYDIPHVLVNSNAGQWYSLSVSSLDGWNYYNCGILVDGIDISTLGVTDVQGRLISGTNIKTINNTSILGSGNIDIQGGGSTYTAGTGIDITNGEISVTSPTLTNTATGSNALTISGTAATAVQGVNIGYNSSVTSEGDVSIGYGATSNGHNEKSTAIGYNSNATGAKSVALGGGAEALANGSIAIGKGSSVSSSSNYGIAIGAGVKCSAYGGIQLGGYSSSVNNTEAGSFHVALTSSGTTFTNYKLLGSDGKIPTARLTAFTGADGTNAGTIGAVPAPTATDNTKFLKGDGTWAAVSGGGSTYTAGSGIDITNDTISVKYDNDTITLNANGQLQSSGGGSTITFRDWSN